MDSSRRTTSRRDTTAGSPRDTSNRSGRGYDMARQAYDRAYSARDAAGQGGVFQ